VKRDDVLFQIDPAPFQYKVTQLQASLAAAKQQTTILKANYEQATANVTGLTAQVAYNAKRLADIQNACDRRCELAIPGAGQAGPVSDGVRAISLGQSGAAKRYASCPVPSS
jgi:multidrug resistance efflux pump